MCVHLYRWLERVGDTQFITNLLIQLTMSQKVFVINTSRHYLEDGKSRQQTEECPTADVFTTLSNAAARAEEYVQYFCQNLQDYEVRRSHSRDYCRLHISVERNRMPLYVVTITEHTLQS